MGIVGFHVQRAASADFQGIVGEQGSPVCVVLYVSILQGIDGSGHQLYGYTLGIDDVDGGAGGVGDGHAVKLQHHLFLRIDFNLSVRQAAAYAVGASLGDAHPGAPGGNAGALKADAVPQQGDGFDFRSRGGFCLNRGNRGGLFLPGRRGGCCMLPAVRGVSLAAWGIVAAGGRFSCIAGRLCCGICSAAGGIRRRFGILFVSSGAFFAFGAVIRRCGIRRSAVSSGIIGGIRQGRIAFPDRRAFLLLPAGPQRTEHATGKEQRKHMFLHKYPVSPPCSVSRTVAENPARPGVHPAPSALSAVYLS